jgi:hypothetical protein
MVPMVSGEVVQTSLTLTLFVCCRSTNQLTSGLQLMLEFLTSFIGACVPLIEHTSVIA